MFIYLKNDSDTNEAVKVLSHTSGVERVYTRSEAEAELRLHHDRIGDLVVTGDSITVFGCPEEVEMPPNLRSHASAYEQDIPIFGYMSENISIDETKFSENRSIGKFVFDRILS